MTDYDDNKQLFDVVMIISVRDMYIFREAAKLGRTYHQHFIDDLLGGTEGKRLFENAPVDPHIAELEAENAIYRDAIDHLYNYHAAMTSAEIDHRLRKALEINE